MNYSEIVKTDKGYRLLLDGKPALVLGGEIHNSSASDPAYMEEKVWPSVRKLHLNTLIAPIYWELLEPEEGHFDFTMVDALIAGAEREHVKLVLLWFGLWKNAESTYTPAWIKADPKTYFPIRNRHQKPLYAISPLCEKGMEKDAAAFSRLLSYLKEKDQNHTVILVQVENEMGVVGEVRDFSPAANEAYRKALPAQIAELFGKSGTWQEAFGEDAPEFFMAYQYAKTVEHIAAAGKKAYEIPLYVNCWVDQFPRIPGNFPSGGPVAHVMKIWKAVAPSVDVMAPDIYLPYFEEICGWFTKENNPLLIPEARPSQDSASNVFSAVGRFHALGFCPFAIEDLGCADSAAPSDEVLKILSIDPSAFRDSQEAGDLLGGSYRVLENLSPVLLDHYGTESLQGFTQYQLPGTVLHFSRFNVVITYSKEGVSAGGGLVVQVKENEFLVAGRNFKFSFLPKIDAETCAQIVTIEEGDYQNGAWVRRRVLNGDERYIPALENTAGILRVVMREVE